MIQRYLYLSNDAHKHLLEEYRQIRDELYNAYTCILEGSAEFKDHTPQQKQAALDKVKEELFLVNEILKQIK